VETVIQQTLNGLSIGSIYALIAVGYSLIYSILQFSNFAHGSFLIAGAYAGFFAMAGTSLPFPVVMVMALAFSGVVAMVTERLAYRPIRMRGSKALYFIIASLGVSIFAENLVIVTIGPQFRTYPQLLAVRALHLGGISVGILDMVAAGTAMTFLLILNFVVTRTKTGMAIRAASFDLPAAGLMGVNVNRIIGTVFFIAGLLAGVSGILLGMKYTVYPQLGYLTIKAFVAAIFGGLGSLPGAILGSLCLGVIETFTAGFISSTLRDLIVFTTLIVILLVRPSGILGRYVEEKV